MQIVILNYQDRNFMGSLSYNHSYQSKVGLLEIQEFLNKTSFMGFTPGKRLMSPLSKSGKGGSWSAREGETTCGEGEFPSEPPSWSIVSQL